MPDGLGKEDVNMKDKQQSLRTEPLILWFSPEERETFLHEHAVSKIKSRTDWIMSLLATGRSDETDADCGDTVSEKSFIKVYDCRNCPWANHREKDLVFCDVCVRTILDGVNAGG